MLPLVQVRDSCAFTCMLHCITRCRLPNEARSPWVLAHTWDLSAVDCSSGEQMVWRGSSCYRRRRPSAQRRDWRRLVEEVKDAKQSRARWRGMLRSGDVEGGLTAGADGGDLWSGTRGLAAAAAGAECGRMGLRNWKDRGFFFSASGKIVASWLGVLGPRQKKGKKLARAGPGPSAGWGCARELGYRLLFNT